MPPAWVLLAAFSKLNRCGDYNRRKKSSAHKVCFKLVTEILPVEKRGQALFDLEMKQIDGSWPGAKDLL